MSVGKIISSAVSGFQKMSKTEKALVGVGVAGTGLITAAAYKAAKRTRKQNTDYMNYFYLSNPILNPIGCFSHMLNPAKTELTPLDVGLVRYLVEQNNKRYQEYYDKLPPSEKVKEFYQNGGKGVIFA